MLNILKQVTQNKGLMAKYSGNLQEVYKPIFEYMVDPSKITFEDDILNILKNFIKKTCKVSDVMYTVLPCLEKVFIKNKQCFGNTLLDTLNYYMVHGRDRLAQDPGTVSMLIRIAIEAMFTIQPNVTVNNSEGAIFLAIIFQIFQGTEILNEFFENIMDKVLERMRGSTQLPVKSSLKKHLLQVFLAALYYNPSATVKYMEMKQVSKNIIVETFKLKKNFKSTYEHKCFIVGITNMLNVYDAPASIKDPSTISRLIHEILAMLDKVKKKEAKDALKKGNKQIQNDDSDSDSDASSSDEDYDDEDEDSKSEDISKKGGKRSRGNSDGMMQDESEPKPFGMTD
jgi:hypothetical protein